jgi:phosphoglycolate phosphatase-like HAD superfamily hydrolase
MDKLLLFDIDGTLMEESPTHTESFNYVCRKIYDVKTDIESFPRHGMTDIGIMYGLLEEKGLSEMEIRAKLDVALDTMGEYVYKNIKPADYKLLKNVNTTLEILHLNGYHLGILTGNLQSIAETRLGNSGIGGYFKTGGYGSDNIVRSKLVDHAIERYGKEIQRSDIYLIGDTPLDIKAAREAYTKAIGVATGVYSTLDLSSADFVLKNFKDVKNLLNFLEH